MSENSLFLAAMVNILGKLVSFDCMLSSESLRYIGTIWEQVIDDDEENDDWQSPTPSSSQKSEHCRRIVALRLPKKRSDVRCNLSY